MVELTEASPLLLGDWIAHRMVVSLESLISLGKLSTVQVCRSVVSQN